MLPRSMDTSSLASNPAWPVNTRHQKSARHRDNKTCGRMFYCRAPRAEIHDALNNLVALLVKIRDRHFIHSK
jgi:hypothetical protein